MANSPSPSFALSAFLLLFAHFSFTSSAFSPLDNRLLACGSSSAATLDDRRVFLPDCADASPALLRSQGHHISVRNLSPAAPLLHQNARIFTQYSSYEFDVKSGGVHFIRLHFYPFTAPEYNLSSAKFHVLASDVILLANFSTSEPLLKEFLINAAEGKLVITFAPAASSSFAFVNAIEFVSAPKDLILDSARLVYPDRIEKFNGLSQQAMETLYRINVGGRKVTPYNDTLWRTWVPDAEFLKLDPATKTVTFGGRIRYLKFGASREVAPDHVYNTARVLDSGSGPGSNQSMAWEFPVVAGYNYLIRMHFCDIASLALNQLYFNVYINGYLAYEDLDLSSSTFGTLAAPYYVDFVIDVEHSELLSVSIGASIIRGLSINGLLNGLEIMKMNNTMGSLDGKSPVLLVSENPLRRGFGAFLRSIVSGFAFMSLLGIAYMLFLRWQAESRNRMAWSRLPSDISNGNLVKETGVSSKFVKF